MGRAPIPRALACVLSAVLATTLSIPLLAGGTAAAAVDKPYLTERVPRAKGCLKVGPQVVGVKVYLIQKRLGLTSSLERYDAATEQAVEDFQRSHDLPVTGRVGRTTWKAMGIKRGYCVDRYTKQPKVPLSATRRERIDAMIEYARKRVGKRYIWGGAGPMGFDCSGLALQAFYAAGLAVPEITTYQHQQADFRTSWTMYTGAGLRKKSFAKRKRGDLVFWGEPGTVTHVALYLGKGRIVEAVRPQVRLARLADSHPDVPRKAYVVRPFPRSR